MSYLEGGPFNFEGVSTGLAIVGASLNDVGNAVVVAVLDFGGARPAVAWNGGSVQARQFAAALINKADEVDEVQAKIMKERGESPGG